LSSIGVGIAKHASAPGKGPDRLVWIKLLLWPLLLSNALRLGWLVYAAQSGRDPNALGADPIAYLTHQTGAWAAYCLGASLAMTPLRRLSGWAPWIRLRRLLGLFAFFYASLHLAIYAGLDLSLDLSHLWADIVKRPYITVGFSAWLLLLPLAITSTRGMMRRLGRRWGQLHRAVYLIGALVVLHYAWLVKADLFWPIVFGVVYAVLMLLRWWPAARRRAAPVAQNS
jgi:methionine sulfoxide reductase heme-binding subunit